MMKKNNACALSLILLTILFSMAPAIAQGSDEDIAKISHCPICGMDRQMFAHSRMLIHYEDGTQFGTCSVHCAALEMAYHPGKIIEMIEVADYWTRHLIDAQKATWVLGGSKMGVMTKTAKWAFADQKEAQRFLDQNGGKIIDFETAMSETYSGMYEDTKMIREKRAKMKKGQMTKGAHHQGGHHMD